MTHLNLVAVLLVLHRLAGHARLHVRQRNGVQARDGVVEVPALPTLSLEVAADRHRHVRGVAVDSSQFEEDRSGLGVVRASCNLEELQAAAHVRHCALGVRRTVEEKREVSVRVRGVRVVRASEPLKENHLQACLQIKYMREQVNC